MAPDFDLILADAFWSTANLVAARAARKSGLPYVLPLHGQLNDWALKHHGWKKRIFLMLGGNRMLKQATAIHCTDSTDVHSLEKFGLESRAFLVPHGLNLSKFRNLPENGRLHNKFGIPAQASLILFMGRLKKIKRPDIAIYALHAACAASQDVHLVIAGPDEDHLAPGLVKLSRELGCADRVHLSGLLSAEEVLTALADANLLIMPTEEQENFGMSALEALAAGVPVLTSPGVPVGQAAESAGAGRVSHCTPEAFAQATLELLADPDRLKTMGQRGRELVRQRFDISVIARRMVEQLRAIVDTGRPLLD
jgi:glycosyltransferase involved in cell wall biosynthesis